MLDRKIIPPIHDAVDFHFELPFCKQSTLSNGIPVYWLNAGTQDVVQIEWIFEAGLWHEPHQGVAYATASLLKTGTLSKSSEALNEALEFYGASLKSDAGNDYSSLTLYCLTKHLNKVLPVVREIIFESAFREEELEIYKKNAVSRLAVNLKKVDFIADREGDALIFGKNHPYGRYSTETSYLSLHTQELRDFRQHYYNSSNCKIFMAGNIDEHHIHEIEHFFGNNGWGDFQTIAPKKSFDLQPGQNKKIKIDLNETGVQGAVRFLRHFPTRQHPDFNSMLLLNTVLGGYFGSRLMNNIREDKGYTYGIYSTIYSYKNEGCFSISTEAGKDVCDATVEEIRKEIDILCKEPISEEELSLVKNYLFGSLLGNLDGPFNLLRRWKSLILNGFDETHFYKTIETYRELKAEDLQQLAQKYFQPEDFYELVVL